MQLVGFAPRRGDEQRRSTVGRGGAQFVDGIVQAALEGRLQYQVLRRIPGQHQFGENHGVGALLRRLSARLAHLGNVAGNVADRGVQLGDGDVQRVGHPSL